MPYLEEAFSKRHSCPFISVGMPVYNCERYLERAIESIINQTFKDLELIIADNFSSDRTEAICREYQLKDHRIKYHRNERNIGLIANFRLVLEKAGSDYFMWAAADDTWSPEWIERLVQAIFEKKTSASFGEVLAIDQDGNVIDHPSNHMHFNYIGSTFKKRLKYFITPEFLGTANVVYGVFRTKHLLETRWFGSRTGVAEDNIFIYNLLKSTDVAGVRGVKIHKRIHFSNSGGGLAYTNGFASWFRYAIKLKKNILFNKTDWSYLQTSNIFEWPILLFLLPLKHLLRLACKLLWLVKCHFGGIKKRKT